MKELKIEIPEGYEIDTVNSTFEKIVFKKKQQVKTWNDLCEQATENLKGYYVDNYSDITAINMSYGSDVKEEDRNIFLTREEAVSSRAASMITQLMPYYGGAITKEEWGNDTMYKYIIRRTNNCIDGHYASTMHYHFLAFKTVEHRDNFLENCRDLVKEYLML